MVNGACSLVLKGPREDVSPLLCPIKAQRSTGSRGSRSPRGGEEGARRQRSGKGTDFGGTDVVGRAEGRGRDERARSRGSSGEIANALSGDTGARLDMDSDAMLGVHTLMMLAGRV